MEKQECDKCKGTGRIFEKHINIECNKCNGTGVISNELEQKCDICIGTGIIYEANSVSPAINCDRCEGTGMIPTEFGEKILDLIIHNLKPILKEIIK